MSAIQVKLLGYVCINPKNKEDFKVCTGLEELSTSVDLETLPIVRKSVWKKEHKTFPPKLNDSNAANIKIKNDYINSKFIIGTFRQTFPDLRLDQELQEKYSVPVLTNRKMLRELLSRLAFTNGQQTAPKKEDKKLYKKDYLLYKDEESDSLIIRYETPETESFPKFGLDVENYIIQRNARRNKCYQVFSIHVLTHQQTKTSFVYSAQVDGFVRNEKTKELTPVEIKCFNIYTSPPNNVTPQYLEHNVEPHYLQARLGKVKLMIFAPFNEQKDPEGVVTSWAVRKFERSVVPNAETFPEYEKRILLLSKLIEYNRDVTTSKNIQIKENANGEIKKIEFVSENCKDDIPISCVLGKCEHKKSNATSLAKRRCKKNVKEWREKVGLTIDEYRQAIYGAKEEC